LSLDVLAVHLEEATVAQICNGGAFESCAYSQESYRKAEVIVWVRIKIYERTPEFKSKRRRLMSATLTDSKNKNKIPPPPPLADRAPTALLFSVDETTH
jgi:hypothetical protein